MEGKPPDDDEREQPAPGGWLPPAPPGGQSPGVFAPPPYQPPADQIRQPGPQHQGEPPSAPPGGQAAPPPTQPPAFGQPPPGPAPGGFQPPPPVGPGAPPPPPGWNQPPWQGPGWQQQPWQPAPAGPGNGTAVTGFVLSISALALLFFSAGLSTLISLGLAVAGAIVGRNGRDKVDRGETTQHRGLGQAGFIIGIVGAVLSVLAIVAWTLIFTLVDDFGGNEDIFDEEFEVSRTAGRVLAGLLRLAA